jgi:DNA polymerase I
VLNRKEKRVTFDEGAILKLMKLYPLDPLYPLLLEHREYQKLLSTYVGITGDKTVRGGMPVGKDGRIHCLFTHNPRTLRLASQDPNMQNLPRPGKAEDLASMIRNMIVAGPGQILVARDFSGIEAVLVGYEARSPRYIRLAKIDVHSYYTAYAMYELDRRISANDLPDISWDDDRLIAHLAGIKSTFKQERNALYKHLIHAGNFGQQPKGAQAKIFKETRVEHPLGKITSLMNIYRELFPEIPRWQNEVQLQADRDGFLRNAFGYIHRFYRVYAWTKISGQWKKQPGEDADKVLAFKPQSNASGILKEAMLRLFFDRFEEAGQHLRLTVHDELLCECPETYAETLDGILLEEMEKPIMQMALPASYKMGPYLTIGTEGKIGQRWGNMR